MSKIISLIIILFSFSSFSNELPTSLFGIELGEEIDLEFNPGDFVPLLESRIELTPVMPGGERNVQQARVHAWFLGPETYASLKLNPEELVAKRRRSVGSFTKNLVGNGRDKFYFVSRDVRQKLSEELREAINLYKEGKLGNLTSSAAA